MPAPTDPWPPLRDPAHGTVPYWAGRVAELSDADRCAWEERAAIVAEGCGITQEAAEHRAGVVLFGWGKG